MTVEWSGEDEDIVNGVERWRWKREEQVFVIVAGAVETFSQEFVESRPERRRLGVCRWVLCVGRRETGDRQSLNAWPKRDERRDETKRTGVKYQ